MKVDNLIKQRLLAKGARAGLPVMGTFELTPRCNLQCKMCYIRLTEKEMRPLGRELTATQWLSLAREAVDAGMVFLLLTGGEPLLRKDFPVMYESLAQMGFIISINIHANGFHKSRNIFKYEESRFNSQDNFNRFYYQ